MAATWAASARLSPVKPAEFLERWRQAGPAERANKDLFLAELCRVLEVEQPRPRTNGRRRRGAALVGGALGERSVHCAHQLVGCAQIEDREVRRSKNRAEVRFELPAKHLQLVLGKIDRSASLYGELSSQ